MIKKKKIVFDLHLPSLESSSCVSEWCHTHHNRLLPLPYHTTTTTTTLLPYHKQRHVSPHLLTTTTPILAVFLPNPPSQSPSLAVDGLGTRWHHIVRRCTPRPRGLLPPSPSLALANRRLAFSHGYSLESPHLPGQARHGPGSLDVPIFDQYLYLWRSVEALECLGGTSATTGIPKPPHLLPMGSRRALTQIIISRRGRKGPPPRLGRNTGPMALGLLQDCHGNTIA